MIITFYYPLIIAITLKYFSFPYNLLFSHVFLFSTLDPRFLQTSTSEVASEENNELVVASRSSAFWKCLPRCYLRSRLEVQSKLRTRVGKYVCVRWMLVGFAAEFRAAKCRRLRALWVTGFFRIVHGRW